MKTRSATSNARRTLLRRGRDLLKSVSKGRRAKVDVMERLSAEQRTELGQIHLALERIERGIFGFCQECSARISEERLTELPWKPECATCDAIAERASEHVAGHPGAGDETSSVTVPASTTLPV